MDSLNLAFIYLILSLISFIDFIGGFEVCSLLFSFFIILLFFLFLLAFLFSSLLFFFISFECLVIIVFLISFIFCGSYYKISTSFYLYSISIIGCLFLYAYISLFITFYFYSFILSLCLFLPFFINIPSFPWFYWLPEIHCEVNTTISLFLAALLLKLGVYGILSYIYNSLFMWLCVCVCGVLVFSIVGSFVVLGCLIRCYDIKKIIGYSSILHLSFNLMVLFGLNIIALFSGIICSVSHGFASLGLFLIVGIMINKSYSSYMDCWYFIDYLYLVCLVVLLLCNLSFPGSLNFMSELLSLVCIYEIDCYMYMLFIIYSFLSYFYFLVCFSRVIPIISSYIMWGVLIWGVMLVIYGLIIMFGLFMV